MSKLIGIVFLLAASMIGQAQGTRMRLMGRIEPARDAESFYVELRDAMGHAIVDRTAVQGDGTFTFEAPPGNYDVRVMTAIHNEVVTEEYVQLSMLAGTLVVRLPEQKTSQPVSGTISVKELQARVPKKAWQEFVKAQHASEAGKPEESIRALRRAIELAPQWRDPHTNLGVQLLRQGHAGEALKELREAVRIGPPTAMLYTDMAVALATAQRMPEGEALVRQALALDPADARAQYLLGHMLAMQPGREKEALENLHRSEEKVPAARIVEAQVLMRSGDRPAAEVELREYLKSGDRGHRTQAENLLHTLR